MQYERKNSSKLVWCFSEKIVQKQFDVVQKQGDNKKFYETKFNENLTKSWWKSLKSLT